MSITIPAYKKKLPYKCVELPDFATSHEGRLYIGPMPGRYQIMEDFYTWIHTEDINLVLCLTPYEEIENKSHEYYLDLQSDNFPVEFMQFPIEDFGAPRDDEKHGFFQLCNNIANDISTGKRVYLHCGAGIGRSGLMSFLILRNIGVPAVKAKQQVRDAGGYPETDPQQDYLVWAENVIKSRMTISPVHLFNE